MKALNPFKLLVVDDDQTTRMLVHKIMSRQGYDIILAENGAEALAAFQSARPDLVLMDVMMPVMDGFEACRQIREIEQDESTPVLMLTSADDMEAIERAFTVGASDFITKPINWPLLSARLRYALRGGQLNRELRRNRLQQTAARQIARLGFWEWQLEGNRLRWSGELQNMLGIEPSQLATVDALIERVHPDDKQRVRHGFSVAPLAGGRLDLELRLQSGGQDHVVRIIGERGLQGMDQAIVFGAFQDMTETRRTEALVDYLALHDDLTGLANRRMFIRQAREILIDVAAREDESLLIGWIDLARFHRHNDALGEAAGDVLLTMVAKRLRMLVGEENRLARVGGDEFAVLLRTHNDHGAIHRFENLLESLNYPFTVDQHETFISYTAGIASYPAHGADAEQLLVLAQDAQRTARLHGKQLMLASVAEDRQASKVLDTERALRRALENQEFYLDYQPQMDLRSGQICGVEALLRWRHPTLGVVPPIQFIPLLEESGLIVQVGKWVLDEACRQASEWQRKGLQLRVGINISPQQFQDEQLYAQVVKAARSASVVPSSIELEITESLAMQDPERSIELLERFRKLGFNIAIDDFGIGHSSLEYLLRFPLAAIKIDRAFVTNITTKQADRAIVRAVTAIGQTLGLKIIAEGVETLRQCDFIEALGVTEIQGYLIGKPVSPQVLENVISQFRRPGLAVERDPA